MTYFIVLIIAACCGF